MPGFYLPTNWKEQFPQCWQWQPTFQTCLRFRLIVLTPKVSGLQRTHGINSNFFLPDAIYSHIVAKIFAISKNFQEFITQPTIR